MPTIIGAVVGLSPSLPFAPRAWYTSGMRRLRDRLRRLLKWGGLGLSLAIVLVWAASLHWTLVWVRAGTPQRPTRTQVVLTSGCVQCTWLFNNTIANEGWGVIVEDGLEVKWASLRPRFFRTAAPDGSPGFLMILPLWMPLLLIAIPTAFLWWRDRHRERLGDCRCGYDLTGNTSGVCPECGERI